MNPVRNCELKMLSVTNYMHYPLPEIVKYEDF